MLINTNKIFGEPLNKYNKIKYIAILFSYISSKLGAIMFIKTITLQPKNYLKNKSNQSHAKNYWLLQQKCII